MSQISTETRKQNYTRAVVIIIFAILHFFGTHYNIASIFTAGGAISAVLSEGLPDVADGMYRFSESLSTVEYIFGAILLISGVCMFFAQKSDNIRFILTILGVWAFSYLAYALLLLSSGESLLGIGASLVYNDLLSAYGVVALIFGALQGALFMYHFVKYKKDY